MEVQLEKCGGAECNTPKETTTCAEVVP